MANMIGGMMSPLVASMVNVGNVATVAAAGSSNTDAATLTGDTNLVTGADGTKGVILPGAEVGSLILVSNQAGSALKVYPPASGKLNALTATTGNVSVAANKGGAFYRADSVNWVVVYA
jgi:hypothetical protein